VPPENEADKKPGESEKPGDGPEKPGEGELRPGHKVKWHYTKGGMKCSGMGEVKSCHMKGEDMPDSDNGDEYLGMHGESKKATETTTGNPARMKCPVKSVLVKCYGMKAVDDAEPNGPAVWGPTGRHELHPHDKMTVLHDGEAMAGPTSQGAMEPGEGKHSQPQVIKSMLSGPYFDGWPSINPLYRNPFENWECEAIMRALESLYYRLQSGISTVICSDVLDPTAKVELVGRVIEAYKPAALRVIARILEDEKAEATVEAAAKSLAIVARERFKAIEAPYRIGPNGSDARTPNDKTATVESFAEWFSATESVGKELRDALTRRIDVRLKAGRMLSEATLSQLDVAIESAAAAHATLMALRDRAMIKPDVEGDATDPVFDAERANLDNTDASGKIRQDGSTVPVVKPDGKSVASLKADALRRRAEMRRATVPT
jgi:hypothetical protein